VSLVDHLMTKDKLELAKLLSKEAHENADLKRRLLVAETELFWMKVRELNDHPRPSCQAHDAG
jgi:hypothetical protein